MWNSNLILHQLGVIAISNKIPPSFTKIINIFIGGAILSIIVFNFFILSRAIYSFDSEITQNSEIIFIGPRGNLPKDAPQNYGFWSFAIPVTGVISRSGQPLINGFLWLKKNGWKSIINLRFDNEYNEIADDIKIPGFIDLDFNYLWLPIRDGSPPTKKQASEFLNFVTEPKNQPVHVHCRGGYGRTGTLIALYRYEICGWPMKKAIEESRLFHGGVSKSQEKWLEKWQEK